MENWHQSHISPQLNFYNVSALPTIASQSFGQFIYPNVFLSSMINRISTLQKSLQIVLRELSQLRTKKGVPPATNTTGLCLQQENQSKVKVYRQPKVFPKHLKCPMQGCRRYYSSRIAMRSHLRKCHQSQFKNNSG